MYAVANVMYYNPLNQVITHLDSISGNLCYLRVGGMDDARRVIQGYGCKMLIGNCRKGS